MARIGHTFVGWGYGLGVLHCDVWIAFNYYREYLCALFVNILSCFSTCIMVFMWRLQRLVIRRGVLSLCRSSCRFSCSFVGLPDQSMASLVPGCFGNALGVAVQLMLYAIYHDSIVTIGDNERKTSQG